MKVYNFGSLNIDHVYEVAQIVKPGETISSFGYEKLIGGKGLNQSIALSKAGMTVSHLGAIGKDGRFLVEVLKENQVETDLIFELEAPTGHAIIQLDEAGSNSIVLFPGANHQVTKSYIDKMLATITSHDIILLQNEISNIDYIINRASELKIPVALNLAPVTKEALNYDLSKLTYLIINETEGNALTNETDEKIIGQNLVEKYPNLRVVLTLGESGSIYFYQDEVIVQEAYLTEAVDTTGAGDTFTGYFLAILLKENDIKLALKMASIASSLAVMTKGAANSIPELKMVMTRLNELI